jgi:hypothetical protein
LEPSAFIVMRKTALLTALAQSLLAGDFNVDAAVSRMAHTLGRHWSWFRPLAHRYLLTFVQGTRPREREVAQFLEDDRGFRKVWSRYADKLSIAHLLNESQQMQPVDASRDWDVPEIVSVGELARWLGVEAGELEWFADLASLGYKQNCPRLRHYRFKILTKQSGSLRLIEAPKSRLKLMQRKILDEILGKIPPHQSVHGFVPGRSIKTFVAPHVAKRVILRMDVQDSFPSFPAARIQALFRTMGYPEPVADRLGGICTSATPRDVWSRAAFGEDEFHLWEARHEAEWLYSRRHLPQGAPTSPALANLCFYRLDCRLAGLAKAAGANYTRYADDLAFSGGEEFESGVERFSIHVAAILHEEGFRVRHRKTRIMRRGVRQHLAGVVANERMNIRRLDFDRLKATLTNCVRLGPEGQNHDSHPLFREHLKGRVDFVATLNPAKGARLRRIFDQIQWES